MITLTRSLRPLERAHGVKLRVSYGKVAEYQRRGVVHFHALIRLDAVDPADPDAILAPPDGITAADLVELVADATATTGVPHPGLRRHHPLLAHRAGARSSTSARSGSAGDQITAEAVAAYLAKYATKATEPTGLPITARMTAEAAEHYSDPDTHLGRLDRLRLPTRHPTPRLEHRPAEGTTGTTPGDGSAAGPTCSASAATSPPRARRYSTTHKTLRADRRTWRTHPAARLAPTPPRRPTTRVDDDETTLIVCDLTLAGIGWNTTADAQLAADAAARAREHRAVPREERSTA